MVQKHKKLVYGDARDNMPEPEPHMKNGGNYRSTMPRRDRTGMKKSGDK